MRGVLTRAFGREGRIDVGRCSDTFHVGSHINLCQCGSIDDTSATITPTVNDTSECVPTGVRPLALDEATQRAALLKALADPVRLQLLSIIGGAPGREACVCDMTELVDVAQPTVSHHLKVLVDAGLVTRHRRGNWAWFRLDANRLADVRGFLD